MSTLSQYHPFRDNVNKSATASPATSSETEGAKTTKDEEDKEYKPWLSFKTKMRLAVASVGFVVVWYVVSSFFAGSSEFNDGFYSSLDKVQGKKSPKKVTETTNDIFDEHDLDDRGRSISDARSKVGFFKGLFCKGGKKASFCD